MRDDQQTDVLERIIHEFRPASIRVVTAYEQFYPKDGVLSTTPGMNIERTYIETAKGQRYYEESSIVPDGRTARKKYFSDGKKNAAIYYKEGETSKMGSAGELPEFRNEVREGYYEAPEPYRWAWVGLKRLEEVLPSAEKLGEVQVLGRPCDPYLFAAVKSPTATQTMVYTLDRATSVPVRVVAYWDPQHFRDERPTWIWEALSLDTIGDHHYPMKSYYQAYLWSEKDKEHLNQIERKHLINVTSIEYDKPYPEAMFWPKAEIAEYDAMIKAAEKAMKTAVPAPVTQVANPIADDGSEGGWPMWPGLVLSAALIVAALVVRTRSQ